MSIPEFFPFYKFGFLQDFHMFCSYGHGNPYFPRKAGDMLIPFTQDVLE